MVNNRCDNFRRGKQIKRWTPSEEIYFLDAWARRAEQLKKSKKNSLVYMEMREDLRKQYVYVEVMDIKTKIDTCIRKFRTERSKEAESKWIHYTKVGQILDSMEVGVVSRYHSTTEVYNAHTTYSSVYIDQCAALKFSEDYKCSAGEFAVEPYYPKKMILDSTSRNENISSTAPNENKRVNQNFQLFSDLIAKELYGLDDNLRVETERKIFNIICDAKMIQIDRNK